MKLKKLYFSVCFNVKIFVANWLQYAFELEKLSYKIFETVIFVQIQPIFHFSQ